MPTPKKPALKKTPARSAEPDVAKTSAAAQAEEALASLKSMSTKAWRDGMARFAIPSDNAFGVPMGSIQALGKRLGRNHDLAIALWKTGNYEARMLAAYVDEPEKVTPAQMDQWCADFDNWATCDTVCFALFDRTPHAWEKVAQWARSKEEFIKRGAFALMWGLARHDKKASDAPFLKGLQLIEKAATDERNFVKKAVDMALRTIGKRNAALNAAALETAQRLAASKDPTAKWVGKHAHKELSAVAARGFKT